ncbi:MAG: tripartite tricarboxylate transporter permease, partial [Sphaerochaeta sp.]|nr:tripartite tricarboxylate transporter permease [Sphaerochaeta sp.]
MLQQLTYFVSTIGSILISPIQLLLLFGSMILGIVFGALPGLTATLGVALLTTITYSMNTNTALIALFGIYIGAIYGGSYGSILLNIPGTPSAAATALEGYPMAMRGEGGKALGLTTTASSIGTILGTVAIVVFAPLVAAVAMKLAS